MDPRAPAAVGARAPAVSARRAEPPHRPGGRPARFLLFSGTMRSIHVPVPPAPAPMRPPPRPSLGLVVALASCAIGTTGCDGGPCDAASLAQALAEARPGETVVIGACRIAGSFAVPAGVTLRGVDGSVLASATDAAVVSLGEGSTLASVEVDVDHGGPGVLARDARVVVEDVEVVVTRGLGLGISRGSLDAARLELRGPITDDTAAFAPTSTAETGTFGIVARDLTAADAITLEDVHVRDFAVAAVSIGGGSLVWEGRGDGPDVEGTRGVGVALFGTRAHLSIEVASMRAGVGMPGIGVVASPLDGTGTELVGEGLVVRDGAGYGVFGDHSSVRLDGARLSDLGLMGVRLQGGSLDATDLVAERDGGAGVMAIDTDSVRIERGRLDLQREALFVTELDSVRVADGLEMVRDPDTLGAPPLDLTLIDVSLGDNARAGLLLDASGGPVSQLRLEGVSVSATGTAYGAITQRTPVASGWDGSVTRTGAAAANDAGFSTPLDIVGIMMPPGLVATPPPL